jgi:hypothetical protein
MSFFIYDISHLRVDHHHHNCLFFIRRVKHGDTFRPAGGHLETIKVHTDKITIAALFLYV